MTKAMCKEFVEQVNQMLKKGVDTVEFYSANKNNAGLYSGYNPLKCDDYIGYTDQFEWDRNIEIDEVAKQLKDYSDFAYKVMNEKEYEQWRLGNDYKQFTDLFSPFVGIIILYK